MFTLTKWPKTHERFNQIKKFHESSYSFGKDDVANKAEVV